MQTLSTFCMQEQQDLQSGHLLKPNYKWFFVLQIPPNSKSSFGSTNVAYFRFDPHKHYIHQLSSLDNLHCEFQW